MLGNIMYLHNVGVDYKGQGNQNQKPLAWIDLLYLCEIAIYIQ